MGWQTFRSRRDAAVWLPWLCAVGLVTALGVAVHLWAAELTRDLQTLQRSDPVAATAEAERALRLLGAVVSGISLAAAALLFRYFRLGLREQRLPPAGWWSLGAFRVMVGESAARWSRIGIGMSIAVALCGIGDSARAAPAARAGRAVGISARTRVGPTGRGTFRGGRLLHDVLHLPRRVCTRSSRAGLCRSTAAGG